MEFDPEQVLTKTPQGINATRSGEGLSSKSHAVLKSFDGSKSVFALKKVCVGAAISEAEFDVALKELRQFEYLRVVDAAGEAKAVADAERRMLETLDFTALYDAPPPNTAPAAKPVASAAPRAATAPAPAKAATPTVPAAPAAPAAPIGEEEREREEKAARLKLEAEIRQKLVVALQPRVEEELRARLRPRLEEELRPKLIAALRPGVEAEVRTALIKELTPRVELELKARFAKILAARKVADQQAATLEPVATPVVPTVPPAPIVPAAPSTGPDNGFEGVLASINMPVFSVDRDGVCSYVSPAWSQFSGYTSADVVGKHLVEFFVPADRRAIGTQLSGIVSGAALRFEQQGALTRQGSEPLWVEISAAPLYSAGGEPMGVCGAIRDATESRRIAKQAEADGVRLLLLVDQIDTGVVLEDGDGNIQQVNPALCTLLALDAAPYSLEGMAVTELLERVSKGFIGPDGFLHRVAEIRSAGEDAKDESFVMADGRVIEQDYLAVTVGDNTVGRLWLYREIARAQTRPAP